MSINERNEGRGDEEDGRCGEVGLRLAFLAGGAIFGRRSSSSASMPATITTYFYLAHDSSGVVPLLEDLDAREREERLHLRVVVPLQIHPGGIVDLARVAVAEAREEPEVIVLLGDEVVEQT